MVDFHSHILPELDDGSRSLEESVALLEETARQGIEAIVATPHFYPDRKTPDEFLFKRRVSVEKLLNGYDPEKHPRVYLGAEVAYYSGISKSRHIERLCIEGTRLILIEMPFCKWTKNMIDELIAIREERELIPVLAHIERYSAVGDKRLLYQLISQGILIQSNASFFTERFKKNKAIKLLMQNEIHLLGSDLHNTAARPQTLGRAMAEIEHKTGYKTIRLLSEFGNRLLKDAVPIGKII